MANDRPPPRPRSSSSTAGLTLPDAERLRGQYELRLDLCVPMTLHRAPDRRDREPPHRRPLVRARERLDPAEKLGLGEAEEYDALVIDDAGAAEPLEARRAPGRILDDRGIGGRVHARFAVDGAQQLADIAELDDVLWIEPVAPVMSHNREATAISRASYWTPARARSAGC